MRARQSVFWCICAADNLCGTSIIGVLAESPCLVWLHNTLLQQEELHVVQWCKHNNSCLFLVVDQSDQQSAEAAITALVDMALQYQEQKSKLAWVAFSACLNAVVVPGGHLKAPCRHEKIICACLSSTFDDGYEAYLMSADLAIPWRWVCKISTTAAWPYHDIQSCASAGWSRSLLIHIQLCSWHNKGWSSCRASRLRHVGLLISRICCANRFARMCLQSKNPMSSVCGHSF